MKTRVTVLLVLALAAIALAACTPATPQAQPSTQIPPAQSEPTTAPAAKEPTMDASANPLVGSSWNLSALDGAAPAESGRPATLEFGADGRIAGSTGCNRYFGPFTVDGATLTTGQMGSTMMACPEPLMAQEQTFLGILGAAASYTIIDDTLTITAADGRTMDFTQA